MEENKPKNKLKKKRADGQLTGLSGEFFVAAELLKRGFQTSVTFGNAKAIDLFAYSEESGNSFTIQVKSLRSKNFFPLKGCSIIESQIYVFVILNPFGTPPSYFILRGGEILADTETFGRFLDDPKFPGIRYKDLEPFQDNWRAFE